MADLRTKYLGIELQNPVIAGASALTSNIQTIKRIEEAGAGALVISSLFEEQIQLSSFQMDEALHENDESFAEMTSMFPKIEHAGAETHLMWVKRAIEAVNIPVIASLNAVEKSSWVEYAQKLENTGVKALELNFYSLPLDFDQDGMSLEASLIDILRSIKSSVTIPISVKLSAFFTSPLHFIKKLDDIGVDGFVLFNRLFQPKINIEKEINDLSFDLSTPNDHRLPLRFAGMLHGKIKGDLCASNGIHTSVEAIELLLAGANVFQMVSSLFKNKIEYIGIVLDEIADWMDEKGYPTIDAYRGKLSKKNNPDPLTYTRAKYVKVLRQSGQYMIK